MQFKIVEYYYPNDICIHFVFENERGKIVILKKHRKTQCSILKNLHVSNRSYFVIACF